MNADRRVAATVLLALLDEVSDTGEISETGHTVVSETLAHLQTQEFWQLKAQGKYRGQNASTDTQLAICEVALPALEAALAAWNQDDIGTAMEQLSLAITTNGKVPRESRRKGLRKARA